MSSLRPAKIVAAIARIIGEPLFAEAPAPNRSSCPCASCEEAWRRNRAVVPAAATRRAKIPNFGVG
jgi:hypothetical protein